MPQLKNARILKSQRPVLVGLVSDQIVELPPTPINTPPESGKVEVVKINLVRNELDLLPLPSIGSGRAKTLLAVRPASGFRDLDELKMLSKFKFEDAQWDELAARLDFAQE